VSARNWNRWRPWLIGAAVLALSALAFDALRGLLREVSYAEVVQQIATQPLSDLLLAALATALSYLVLTGYDFSALKYAGRRFVAAPFCSHRSSHTRSVTPSASVYSREGLCECACTRPRESTPGASRKLPHSMPARSSLA
jgi:hypothetical protein